MLRSYREFVEIGYIGAGLEIRTTDVCMEIYRATTTGVLVVILPFI
jgi:hypothetical protein